MKRPLMARPPMATQQAYNASSQQNLPLPPKRPRMNNPALAPSNQVMLPPAESLGLCPPVNHNTVPLRDKFCRVCAGLCSKLGQIFPLEKLPAYIDRAKECLQMEIDLEKDKEEGLPSVICR